MLVIRYLSSVSLMFVLATGCSQSLFDANPGHEGENPPPPPGTDASAPDDPDGGPDDPDGGPLPPGVIDDAVANFAFEQGGSSGRWNYMEVRLGANAVPPVFQQMNRSSRDPYFEAWIGSGSPEPAIVPCGMYQTTPLSYEPCAGVADRLLFETTSADGLAPVLQWTAPATGIYRLQLDARIPTSFPADSESPLRLARNGQFDILRANLPADVLEIDVELVEQDALLLMAIRNEDPPVPVGVGLTIFDQPDAEETCRIAFGFDSENGFQNRCGDRGSFVELGAPTEPGDTPLPPGIPGNARKFVTGSTLQYQGAAIDHSRAWTVQFWARLDPTSTEDQWLLSDLDCNAKGGVAVSLDTTGQLVFEMAAGDGTDYCSTRSTHAVSFTAPVDGAWHFYRMSWNTSLLTVCKDGDLVNVDTARDLVIGAARALSLGRREDRPGSFLGQLADVRVFSAALPCP